MKPLYGINFTVNQIAVAKKKVNVPGHKFRSNEKQYHLNIERKA